MNTSTLSPGMMTTKSTFACVRCSERKVKCNKQIPCGTCLRHKEQCIYRAPKPSRRRRNLSRDDVLDERIRRYEVLLREKGVDPNQVTETSQSQIHLKSTASAVSQSVWQLPSTSSGCKPEETVFRPLLLHGQQGTKLVDNSLWLRVVEEIQDPEALEEDEEPESLPHIGGMSSNDFSYVLGWNLPSMRPSHPAIGHIHRLWQIFVENVDPLLKMVHVPTLQLAIEKAASNLEQTPAGFEALMFSIYSLAVVSITDDECRELLGESREIILPSFVAATKAALSRARFMCTTSIVVLQALVLHILSIRETDNPRAVWSLTGVALRVSDGMGLRIDGTLLGLSPFETEIRRRVWWQLKMHDSRAAELAGQAKFRDFQITETTPRKPANINDSDLSPSMRQAPPESVKPTEMTWCVLRADLATFAHIKVAKVRKDGKAGPTSEEFAALDDVKSKDKFAKEMEDTIETKYLRFCDPSHPIQFMTLLGARLSLNVVRFIAHHPRRWATLDHVPTAEQEFVWSTVIQLLEQYNILQTNPQLRRYAWIAPYFIQWHAVIHILDVLRAEPLRRDAMKAWGLIEALYQNNPNMLLHLNNPIVKAVGDLCLRAFDARVSALTIKEPKTSLPDQPAYIFKLRELRSAAKTKTRVNSPSTTGVKSHEPLARETNPPSRPTDARPRPQPPPRQPHDITLTADDAFWLSDALAVDDSGTMAFDSGAGGGAPDRANLDSNIIDATLTRDYWPETSNAGDGSGIDWAQWDAWVGS